MSDEGRGTEKVGLMFCSAAGIEATFLKQVGTRGSAVVRNQYCSLNRSTQDRIPSPLQITTTTGLVAEIHGKYLHA